VEHNQILVYKNPPQDFNDHLMTSKMISNKEVKPKYALPLHRVVEIGDLSEAERKKFAKNFSAGNDCFKIVFDETSLKKDKAWDGVREENEKRINDKNLRTWYFSTKTDEPKTEEKIADLNDWVSFASICSFVLAC
jgi:hypothetical protein